MTRKLSRREQEVLAALATGGKQNQIARHLGVAASTIKAHVRSIKDKTGIEDTLQLATMAAAGKIGREDLQ